MKELELKHLAPYLPYGLAVIGENGMYTLTGLSPKIRVAYLENHKSTNGGSKMWLLDVNHWRNIEQGYNPQTYKPILRPLSDLNKELMKELFNLIDESDYIELLGLFDEDDFEFQIDDDWNYVISCEDVIEFHFSNNSFGIYDCHNMEHFFISNQYELMEWMFENHFDIFDLIPNNLAIDINTLEK